MERKGGDGGLCQWSFSPDPVGGCRFGDALFVWQHGSCLMEKTVGFVMVLFQITRNGEEMDVIVVVIKFRFDILNSEIMILRRQ